MLEQRRLVQEGRARASRYRVPERKGKVIHVDVTEGIAFRDEGEAQLPVSEEGRAIRQLIRRPIENRQPVGYNRPFLDHYRPNHSFYLSAALRQRLFELGRPAGGRQLAGAYARHIWRRLSIDLSWNSSRLEGNTHSLLETERLLELGEVAEGKKAEVIAGSFEQAFFVTVHIPYLQALEDVNRRVSRLTANISLIRHNLSPLSFVDVPVQAYVDGLLGVYELNRVELLRDVFVWAHERSCARYAAVRRSLGEPDQFRLRHRVLITETMTAIVVQGMDKCQAIAYLRNVADEKLDKAAKMRFVEVVETELMSLHEGNIARYKIRPSQYAHWRKTWT